MQLAEKSNKQVEVLDAGRMSPLEAARRWAQKGYRVLPIAYREKKPAIDGWQNIHLKPEDLHKHFGSIAQNVGLILGEPFGITDVDLDSPESLQLWQVFAPPTKCVFGHQSKRFSHYLFHMDPPGPSLKFTDPISRGTLLELRCLTNDGQVGRQTIIPPSTHKDSGESIRYERGCDGDPANVDSDVLILAVKKTAAACMLARYYPPAGGGRHDAELALAGVLCRAGWSEAAAKEFIIGVYSTVPSHDPKAIGRVSQSVEDTYRRFAEGGDVTGIPRLSLLIEKRAVAVALEWLGIDGGKGSEVNADNWRNHLLLNARGDIIICVANVMLALQYAKEWVGVLNFNESEVRVQALSAPPWNTVKKAPFDWTDEDDVHAAAWMQREGIGAPKGIVGEAIQTVAREHPFHPIREYFERLAWDGIRRIDAWLPTYFGASISEYNHAVGAKFLIGAVARVFRPGCKNDCCMVLEGPQGLFKSTALRILADPWFADHIAELGSKDSQMQAHGVLILEIAELDGMSKSEASAIKSFMSSASDRFRPPYGKHVINVPRESVFAGTVNDGIKYLKDETGARRFWPVKCVRIDIEGLRRDKDQLWAEAVARFQADDSWWLDSVELNREAEQEQAARYDADPWLEKVKAFIEGRPNVSIVEILDQCIQKPTERQMQSDKNRVGRCLRFLNWAERQVQHNGNRERRYFPPEGS